MTTRSYLLIAVLLVASAQAAPAQEAVSLLVAPAEQGVALRWAWGEGERPLGWLIDRRTPGGAWARLTPQPVSRVRDRAAARRILGDQFTRYEGLLFPPDPRAERADPESYRAVLLLSADVEPGVATLLGLRFDDRDAATGQLFEYRLTAITSTGERVVATSGAVAAGRFEPAAAPTALQAAQGSRGFALHWSSDAAFSAYHVYRGSAEDGADARRINEAPVVVFYDGAAARTEAAPAFFVDSAAPRSTGAWYWVEGIDAFGRASRRSAPAFAQWRDLETPAAPPLVQATIAGDTVVVSWLPPAEPDVVAFQVWRSDSSAGSFQRVGEPVRALEYRHTSARRLGWYRVTAIDSAGHEGQPSSVALAEVPDAVAPPSPDGLTGSADVGRLVVRWPRVSAADLFGYRVYRSSTTDSLWGLVTTDPGPDTVFTDTITTTADHAFSYRVSAVDSAFNESPLSAAITLRPPDVTPPSSPRLLTVRGALGALDVAWLPNPEPDVVAYRLLYRESADTAWHLLPDSIERARLDFTIPGLAAGRHYQVSLVAIDDAGNQSQHAPAVAGEPLVPAPAVPELRRAAWDAGARAVVVEWRAAGAGTGEVLVLRREPNGVFRPVGATPADAARFADRTARTGQRYEYALQVRDRDGTLATSRPRQVDVRGAP